MPARAPFGPVAAASGWRERVGRARSCRINGFGFPLSDHLFGSFRHGGGGGGAVVAPLSPRFDLRPSAISPISLRRPSLHLGRYCFACWDADLSALIRQAPNGAIILLRHDSAVTGGGGGITRRTPLMRTSRLLAAAGRNFSPGRRSSRMDG